MRLSWTPNTEGDLAYYVISRDTNPTPTGEYVRIASSAYEDVNQSSGQTYYYRVRAVDRSGNTSAYSNEVSCTTGYIGVITISPSTACITDPGSSYSTAISQQMTVPPGSKYLSVSVQVIAVSIVGSQSKVAVRFSLDTSGQDSSNVQTLTFTSVSTQTVVLKSNSPLSTTGTRTMLYEWADAEGDTSSFQMTNAGSVQVTAS